MPPSCDRLIDSLPVVLAKGSRANRARVAAEIAGTGFCSSKSMYYYGMKLHTIAVRRPAALALPAFLHMSPAAQHDLAAEREINPTLGECFLFGDKAYADQDMQTTFAGCGTHLVTPHKRNRNEPKCGAPPLWSRFVSSVRQPIESHFG